MQGSLIELSTQHFFLNKLLRKQTKKMTMLAGLSLVIVSCGGGGGGAVPASPEPDGEVNGVAFIGVVESGDVNVYSFDGGVRGSSLGSGKITLDNTTVEGSYKIALKTPSKNILVCLSNATYQEITQKKQISFDVDQNQELCAVEKYVSGSTIKVALTYYSHIATGLAKQLISKGESVNNAVTNANQEISAWAGFNINQNTPVNINVAPTVVPGVVLPVHRAGFANAAISVYSGWVNGRAGIGPSSPKRFKTFNSILFAQRAYDDIVSDGLLDGQSANGPTGLGPVTLTTKTYRRDIALDILVMANNKNNLSGINLKENSVPDHSLTLFNNAKAYSFFDNPDSLESKKSSLNIFGNTASGGALNSTAPTLNNFIVPDILSGDVNLAASLTDIKNQAVSVEYKLINNSLTPPVDARIEIFDKSVTPSLDLSRTVTTLKTVSNNFIDDANYEIKVLINGVQAFSKAGIIIQNVDTKIVGPDAVTTSNTVNGIFNLVASVTNSAGIKSISLEIDGNASDIPVSNFTSLGTNNVPIFRIDTTTLANGLHTFVMVVTDTVPLESRSTALSLTVAN